MGELLRTTPDGIGLQVTEALSRNQAASIHCQRQTMEAASNMFNHFVMNGLVKPPEFSLSLHGQVKTTV